MAVRSSGSTIDVRLICEGINIFKVQVFRITSTCNLAQIKSGDFVNSQFFMTLKGTPF